MNFQKPIKHTEIAFSRLEFLRGGILQILAWPILSLLFVTALWYWVNSTIDTEKHNVEKKALEEATQLSMDYEKYLTQVIDRANQITLQLQYNLEKSQENLNLPELAQGGIFRGADILNVTIIDQNGLPVTSTFPIPKDVTFADRDYFVFHKNDDTNLLLVGRPIISRSRDRPVIPFTRRLNTPQGAFNGVAYVAFDPDYLTAFFAGAFPGKSGLLAVAGLDGVLRSIRIGNQAQDSSLPELRTIPLFTTPEGATFLSEDSRFGDNLARYVAWRTLKDYYLVAMVGIPEMDYFAPYQARWSTYRSAASVGSVLTFLLAIVATGMSLRIAKRRFQEFEQRKAYRLATEGGNEGFYMYEALRDRNGSITDFQLVDCNQRGAEFYGVPQSQLIQANLSNLYPEIFFNELINVFLSAMTSGFYEDEIKVSPESMMKIGWAKRRFVRSGNGLAVTIQDITERKQTEEALRLSAERLQLAARAANIGIWDWNIVENELAWDDSMYQLYGIKKADFGGAYDAWISTVHPDDKAHIDREIQAALLGEREYAPEFRIIRPDGSIRYIKADSQTIQNSGGKPLRMIGTNMDITERKRIQEAMERSQSALEEAQRIGHIGSWDLDMLNDVLSWSDEIFRIWEIDKTQFEATFAAFLETVHPEDRDKVALAYNQAIIDKSLYQIEHRLLFPDHRVKYIYERGEPYFDKDGRPLRFIGTSLDITERKLAETELLRYKDQLEETVEQRTAELLLARDAAEAANKAKSVFLANMSHELRTPMNAILGFSGLLRRDPQLTEKQRENLDIINRSGEHLLTLINDVLEVAKIEAGRLKLEIAPFDLGSMVRDVTEMMQIRAQEKSLLLVLDQSSEFPRYIKGDEARIRQIIINLINNAVKCTEQGGVTLRLGVKNNARQHLLVEVEDTGPGIAQEDQQRLFEPFVQLGDADAQQGTGLGLTITRQFVQMMGGGITVESTLGKGAVFRVDLPLALASADEILGAEIRKPGEVVGLSPGQPRYRIMIVEDQRENQLLLTQLMADIGLEVKVVENGQQCLESFQDWRPALIWMDRRMPVMDGIEATKRLRQLPEGQTVKIVAVTASAFNEQQQEMFDVGMDDFVRKPYRFDEIYDCLARQLGVQYIYADKHPTYITGVEPLTAEMLTALPQELRSELINALESLEQEHIGTIIGQVLPYDLILYKTLMRLAENFDYPTILNAIRANLSTIET
ncbi:PAS domain-containing protein [Methylomonas methanica]|uniref:PAS domain-containing protein n=1 Tax=Methylomonas methanica TaxID=421 RepID=UPI0009EF5505|nr:PAS domain-containing protein [Methylomonas methanica]